MRFAELGHPWMGLGRLLHRALIARVYGEYLRPEEPRPGWSPDTTPGALLLDTHTS